MPQGALGEFRTHPEQSGQNHPKNCAGPAHAHRHRHAGDIAQAHGGRKRRRERLEVADLAGFIGIGVTPADAVDGVAESAKIDESELHGEVDCAQNEPDHHGGQDDLAGLAVVPEGNVEEEHASDGGDDVVGKSGIERGECILDLGVHVFPRGRTPAGD